MSKNIRVYIGADHAGIKLKNKIIELLSKKDIYFEDFGAYESNKDDDYTDFAFPVCEKVLRHKGDNAFGILICGTGTGMVIAANKVKGIRAAVGYDNYSVKKGKEDNNINVLCLRGRNVDLDEQVRLVSLFLRTGFSKSKRHNRRIRKISKFEGK